MYLYVYIYIHYIMGFVRSISPQTSLHQLNLYALSGESYHSSQPKTEETHPVDIAVQNVRMDGYEVSCFVKTTSPSKELTS